MSEIKPRKLIEFKIVKSPLKEIIESTASACSPVQKMRKSENSKKKKISCKSDNRDEDKNKPYSRFSISSSLKSQNEQGEIGLQEVSNFKSTTTSLKEEKDYLNKKRRRILNDLKENKATEGILDFDEFLAAFERISNSQENISKSK
jgi:hypothetical protein